ncbi:MAG: thiamine phosphate synthase [Thermodesulfovibrionales bacterium]|nr:thiamine phosphate synthase [Thermodesulfovibrionales bacterium]
MENSISILLETGIKWVQYREKNRTRRGIFYEAVKLRELTKKFNACLIINDHADIALAADADGVHLGQCDLPIREARKIVGHDKIIGVSTHSLSEALEAEREGADYIGFGSVFHTDTKEDIIIQGVDALREVTNSVKIPVIAIGGINPDNVKSVFDTGCYGVAVSSGFLKGDIKENARRFLGVIKEA